MTTSHTDHLQQHGHAHASSRSGTSWKRAHRDWRAWVIVVLMLGAMGAYVMSDDESMQPRSKQAAPANVVATEPMPAE